MARFRGFGKNEVSIDGIVVEESDTLQCPHCNFTMRVKSTTPLRRALPWCSNCDAEHCLKPECFICTPFMKKLEAAEAADRQKRLLWQAADNT
jgi:hypothetical protein